MADPVFIARGEPTNPGMDYYALREEGINLLQQWSGAIWTDYNEHDPGVTTLEQLCYALTELSYRAEFPLTDLLADRTGKIDTRRQALFVPRRILPCNPTTEADYRKLIVDRVRGVANVWLTPYSSPNTDRFVNGLYDIALYAPGLDPCVCDGQPDEAAVRRRTRRVYCRHRGLCEDLHSVYLLKPLRAAVYADVVIESARAPEATLATLFFNLGNFLAPELRRRSLQFMLDRGQTPDEIFNGPLLRHGFIENAQLQPKASSIPMQEIVRVLARGAGVASVRNVRVRTGEGGRGYSGDESVPVPRKSILQLDTRPERKKGDFTIRLFKDGREYRPDPLLVKRELDKLWAEYRGTYPLGSQYERYFAVPRGRYRDLKPYYSIQNQYPMVYGISDYGLPEGAPVPRRAQAKQLKGYLLVFEQLLADFFAQLARVKDLFSTEYALRHTYFYQYLNDSVPNVAPLLKADYRDGLPELVHSQDPFAERRNRFLSFLLALYAERLDASLVAGLVGEVAGEEGEAARLIRAQLALLHHLVMSTRDRGRGFDYLAPASPRNVAGMEIKCRIQLGMEVFGHRPLVDVLDERAVTLAEDEERATVGRPLARAADDIEEHFASVEAPAGELSPADAEAEGSRPTQRVAALSGQTVSEEFLCAAADLKNYRVGSFAGERAVAVVCKSPAEDRWRLVGTYPDTEAALASAHEVAEVAQQLCRHRQQLYIVEHTLLRFGRSKDEQSDARANENGGCEKFVYSFTITAVVSTSARGESTKDYQTFVREVVRQNTPSHIVVDYCFLDLRQMREFEQRYWAWRRTLRRRERRDIVETSARLRAFLRRCRGRAAADEG
ncbi:MAG TPA: hypothetical protein VF297_17375 [Pyrinomonadaceae bacterium]